MKKSIFYGLALGSMLALSLTGCSGSASSDATDNTNTQTEIENESQEKGKIGISFNVSNAKALAGSDGSSARYAREATDSEVADSSKLLKILEDGSVASAITIPEDMDLANINAVLQSPSGTEIYVLFDQGTWYSYWYSNDDGDGQWINIGLSQLLCIYEDGSYYDVLGWDETKGRPMKYIWGDNSSSLKFDSAGILYFMTYDNNSHSSIFYSFNPATKESKQLTAAVSQYSYSEFCVSKDGAYIFVEGYVYGNSSSEAFLRAIPVSDPNNTKNIIYGSWNFDWVYDDYSNALYLAEDTNTTDGGISKYTAETGFATKEWVKQNEEGYQIFTLHDGTQITMTESELYTEDGFNNWPSNYTSSEYVSAVYYNFENLTATKDGIWGTKSVWNNNKTTTYIYKVLDADRAYEGVQYDLPSGYGMKAFVPGTSTLYVLADILSGTSKTGYHTIFSIPAEGGEYTNIFQNVPNSTNTELISWSVSNADTEIFFCGVKGLEITNGKISLSDFTYSTISSGTKLSCITALY